MVGAIEFLKKQKAICASMARCDGNCPLEDWCYHEEIVDEADLVRKVMEYELEGEDAERN